MDIAIEAHNISTNLANAQKEKQEAKTPEAVLELLKKQEETNAKLYNELKYPKDHDSNLLIKIKSNSEHAKLIQGMSKLTGYLQSNTKIPTHSITKLLQTKDIVTSHKILLTRYQESILHTIDHSLKTLKEGHEVHIRDKAFSCPVKYINHVVEHNKHEFMPHKEIAHIQQKVIQHQKQLSMEGPCM